MGNWKASQGLAQQLHAQTAVIQDQLEIQVSRTIINSQEEELEQHQLERDDRVWPMPDLQHLEDGKALQRKKRGRKSRNGSRGSSSSSLSHICVVVFCILCIPSLTSD